MQKFENFLLNNQKDFTDETQNDYVFSYDLSAWKNLGVNQMA